MAPAPHPDFHASLNAAGKAYIYAVETAPLGCDPLVRRFRWHHPVRSATARSLNTAPGPRAAAGCSSGAPPYDSALPSGDSGGGSSRATNATRDAQSGGGWGGPAVAAACAALEGRHDFAAFRDKPRGSARKKPQPSAVCRLERVTVRPLVEDHPPPPPSRKARAAAEARAAAAADSAMTSGLSTSSATAGGAMTGATATEAADSVGGGAWEVVVVGDRFVYKMVRNIVGCLAEVGAVHEQCSGSVEQQPPVRTRVDACALKVHFSRAKALRRSPWSAACAPGFSRRVPCA